MTKLVFLNRADRKERRRIKKKNAAIRARKKILAELPTARPVKPSAPQLPVPRSDEIQAAADAFTWFRDRGEADAKPGPGWSFLASAGWSPFDAAQAEKLEDALVVGAKRLVKVPAGASLLERAAVDLDRMLLLDPVLADVLCAGGVLPPALPVRRTGSPRRVKLWRYSLDDSEAPELPLDEDDSELLSLASQNGRPCVVLYDSARAVVVDLGANRWSDGLWALGLDDEAGDQGGCVARDDEVLEKPRETPTDAADEALVAQLTAMGFGRTMAADALAQTRGSVEDAALLLIGT